VIEELAGAFSGWYAKRRNGDDRANPPGYRKRGEEHPRSTVIWKAAGFRLDTDHDQVRLSKGRTQKSSPRAREYILVECELPPEIDLTADSLQEVRAVYKRGEWRIQFVCTHKPAPEPPGEATAGVDLGIVNVAVVSYSTGATELYPGHALREDEYYLQKELAKCTDSTSRRATRLQETRSGRRAHYLHTITTDIVDTCVDRGVGTLFVGDLHGIRDEDDPDTDQRVAVDWESQGKHVPSSGQGTLVQPASIDTP
jgi:putative transposase